MDGTGNVWIADGGNNRIVQVNQSQAAALAFASTAVGSTSSDSPQTVAVQNIGNAPLVFSALAATTNFNLNGSNTTCDGTTSLNAGTSCDLGVEFLPTVVGTPLSGTINLTDNSLNAVAPNNVQTISLSGTGTGTAPPPPTPSVAVSFSAATVTVSAPGASGTDTITLTPSGGYAGTVTLACSGLPSEATCSFNPMSVTFTAASSAAQTVALTVTTTAATAVLRPYAPFDSQSKGSLPMLATAFWLPGLLAAGAGLRKRKSGKSGVTSQARHMLILLILLAGVGMMTACGGNGGSTGGGGGTTPNAGTPKGTTPVTVTVTGTGSLSTSATFTLAVQ